MRRDGSSSAVLAVVGGGGGCLGKDGHVHECSSIGGDREKAISQG